MSAQIETVVVTMSATYQSGSGKQTRWKFTLHKSDSPAEISGILQNPFDLDEEEDLRWPLEEHAIKDPLSRERAILATKDLEIYAKDLYAQIESGLKSLIGESLQEDYINLRIHAVGEQNTVHILHWEALELLDEQTISVVRIVEPIGREPASSPSFSSPVETSDPVLQSSTMPHLEAPMMPGKSSQTGSQDSISSSPSISDVHIRSKPFRILFITARHSSDDAE